MAGGGGGGRGLRGDMNTTAAIFFIHDTLYGLVKIFLMVFKIKGIVALTIKGR